MKKVTQKMMLCEMNFCFTISALPHMREVWAANFLKSGGNSLTRPVSDCSIGQWETDLNQYQRLSSACMAPCVSWRTRSTTNQSRVIGEGGHCSDQWAFRDLLPSPIQPSGHAPDLKKKQTKQGWMRGRLQWEGCFYTEGAQLGSLNINECLLDQCSD